MKRFALILGMTLGLAAAPWAPGALAADAGDAEKTTLRSGVMVHGNYVLLGDLFVNAGRKSEARIAYAPSPGKKTVFGAQWLYNMARTHGLDWRPFNLKTRSVVERAAQIIHRDEIEDQVIQALEKYGIGNNVEVDFGTRHIQMFVGTDQPASVSVETINYVPASGRFNAVVAAPANSPSAERMRVTGRIHKMVTVPVPTKRLRNHEVIRRDDIEMVKVRERTIKGEVVTHPDDLIGMSARHVIQEGRPVRRRQIQKPVLVPRRSIVTVVHASPFMRLTTQGRALENGVKGDFIQIANLQSKKIIEAQVVGAGRVEVRPQARLAAN